MNPQLTKHFFPGHSSCAGCAFPAIVRTVLGESPYPVVVVNATGCLEVTSTIYPYTAWKVPYIHSAFENAGATVSGIERAYKALQKQGKIHPHTNFRQNKILNENNFISSKSISTPKNSSEVGVGVKIKFVVFSGDGGTYDIGLQSFSGALERGHEFVYVVYDNGGYMNTGNQRSSATPYGTNTETTPEGKESFGKMERRKNLMEIANAHHIPYLAQANVAYLIDLKKKARKAFEASGPTFLNVFSPCTYNWKFPTSQYVQIAKLATETNLWPLYEIENGKYTINWKTNQPKPVEEFLKTQGRFKHLFSEHNKPVLAEIQKQVDEEWGRLKNLEFRI